MEANGSEGGGIRWRIRSLRHRRSGRAIRQAVDEVNAERMTKARRKVTVFGGTGFLGQRVVQHLLEYDFSVRVAARHPERIAAIFSDV